MLHPPIVMPTGKGTLQRWRKVGHQGNRALKVRFCLAGNPGGSRKKWIGKELEWESRSARDVDLGSKSRQEQWHRYGAVRDAANPGYCKAGVTKLLLPCASENELVASPCTKAQPNHCSCYHRPNLQTSSMFSGPGRSV